MRLAKLDDLRRSLEKRKPGEAPRIKRLAFSDLPGFDDTEIAPNIGFIAICGGTGVGKTALLELIFTALEPHTAEVRPDNRPRLGSARVEISIATAAGEHNSARTVGAIPAEDDAGYSAGVELVRLDTRTSYIQAFLDEGDVTVYKEGVNPYSFDAATLEIISASCQKEYKEIVVYEIEMDSDHFVPFFEISLAEVSYDNRAAATGELSILYLAWILRNAEANSVILIEEPEAHLPPSSHAAVFSLIAVAAVRKNLCVIVTTHSPTIAEHAPHSSIVSVRNSGLRSSIPKKAEAKLRVLSRLGLRPKASACFFVEDAIAAATLNEILAWFEFSLVCNIEVIDTGNGIGAVKSALESLPKSITSVRFWGVLDGDSRPEVNKWKRKDNISFLPFDRAIEHELLAAIEGAAAKASAVLGRPLNLVTDTLEMTRGQNHHDRFNAVSKHLQLAPDQLVRGALDRWQRVPGRKTRVKRFAIELARSLGLDLPQG